MPYKSLTSFSQECLYDIQQSGDTGTLCTHVVLTIKDVVKKKKVSKLKSSIQDSYFVVVVKVIVVVNIQSVIKTKKNSATFCLC